MPILTPEERIGSYVAGRYRIDSVLGVGGMGVVFAASHVWTDRRVAVKILSPEYAQDETIVRRFLQEARTAASLNHPNVVDVLDMGEDNDHTVFLVLELLDGESLKDLIERRGSLDPAFTLGTLLPVMRAVAAAHDRGIIHRDIKPDNIFIARDGSGHTNTKLLDFGIAKVLEAASSATVSGSVLGTPYYMSPEQASGSSEIGPPSDVWSMGVVLYQCLSNVLPFDGPTPTAIIVAIASDRAPPLKSQCAAVPDPIAEVIDQALTHDQHERYPAMAALIDALAGAANQAGIPLKTRKTDGSEPPRAGGNRKNDPSAPLMDSRPPTPPGASASETQPAGEFVDESTKREAAPALAEETGWETSEEPVIAATSSRRGLPVALRDVLTSHRRRWGLLAAATVAAAAVVVLIVGSNDSGVAEGDRERPHSAAAPASATGSGSEDAAATSRSLQRSRGAEQGTTGTEDDGASPGTGDTRSDDQSDQGRTASAGPTGADGNASSPDEESADKADDGADEPRERTEAEGSGPTSSETAAADGRHERAESEQARQRLRQRRRALEKRRRAREARKRREAASDRSDTLMREW